VTGNHYFSADPQGSPERRTIPVDIGDRHYRLAAAGGVFSAGRLDPGTSVLLRKASLPDSGESGPLLDLGCGYGPIAVVLAGAALRSTVYAVDVNPRALELTRENGQTAGFADRLVVAHPDEVSEDVRFTQIWANPPVRIGKPAMRDMLLRWLPRLTPEGVAWLVIGRHLGGDSLQRWLAEQGWTAQRWASQQGFRVLRVSRPAAGTPV